MSTKKPKTIIDKAEIKQATNHTILWAFTGIVMGILLIMVLVYSYNRTNIGANVDNKLKLVEPTISNETVLKVDKDKMISLINSYRRENFLTELIEAPYLCKIAQEYVEYSTKDKFLSYRTATGQEIYDSVVTSKYPQYLVTALVNFSVQPGLGGDYKAYTQIKPWDWFRPQYLWQSNTLFEGIKSENSKMLLAKDSDGNKYKNVCFDSYMSKYGDMYVLLFGNDKSKN